jgi:hypothetical protein
MARVVLYFVFVRREAVLMRMRSLTGHMTFFLLTCGTHAVSIQRGIYGLDIYGFGGPNIEKKTNYNTSTSFRGEHRSRAHGGHSKRVLRTKKRRATRCRKKFPKQNLPGDGSQLTFFSSSSICARPSPAHARP